MKCKTCGAPAKHMPPDGDFRYDPPRSTLPREGQGEVDWPPLIRLGRVLGFFASVIKSGEPWTETCQREYDAANLALQSAFQALSPSSAVRDGVVEECARVAERDGSSHDAPYPHSAEWLHDTGIQVRAADRIAAAIRALSTQEQGNG